MAIFGGRRIRNKLQRAANGTDLPYMRRFRPIACEGIYPLQIAGTYYSEIASKTPATNVVSAFNPGWNPSTQHVHHILWV